MHRILNNSIDTNNTSKRPVFLMHGLIDSSTGWIINDKEICLGYILADEGYDVWLGNARGNYFSRKHKKLNPDGNLIEKQKFWTFSWHEIGVYDLTAMIDYIFKTNSAFDKIHYIGISQGTTSFFVMASECPSYNNKILTMHALAPVAYMRNAKGTGRAIALTAKKFESVARSLGILELFPGGSFMNSMIQKFCRDAILAEFVCMNIIFSITGFNQKLVKPVDILN